MRMELVRSKEIIQFLLNEVVIKMFDFFEDQHRKMNEKQQRQESCSNEKASNNEQANKQRKAKPMANLAFVKQLNQNKNLE